MALAGTCTGRLGWLAMAWLAALADARAEPQGGVVAAGVVGAGAGHTHCGAGPTPTGTWKLLPYMTQRPDGSVWPTAHASLLPTGRVLFFPEFDSKETLLWDPSDPQSGKFAFTDNLPGDWLWCSHHVFLSNGDLLVVGGGGNSPGGALDRTWRYDPFAGASGGGLWTQAATMANKRWYPTAVQLGDGRVFVAAGLQPSGAHATQCEVYDETADTWKVLRGPPRNPTGADHLFPETYPSLHLTPGGKLFFSRTGWHQNDTPGTTASYFAFTSPSTGEWIDMTTSLAFPDRTEGMAVQLLRRDRTSPLAYDASILVVAGGSPNPAGTQRAEAIDVSALTPDTAWDPPTTLNQARLHTHAVLLPDGKVLVLGGSGAYSSEIYDPAAKTWTPQGSIQNERAYHSTAILLPTGQVMTAGGLFETIEIFDPPYLLKGPRPVILTAPTTVQQGQTFAITAPPVGHVTKVVLVRPMSVTHHTDSQQRVLELDFSASGGTLTVQAPDGVAIHAAAPRGWYMLFALDCNGVPSLARWLLLS